MEPAHVNDNCFYDDSMNPMMMGDVFFHERFDSKGSSVSSLKGAHAQKKQGANDAMYTGEHTHMGYNDSYPYPNNSYNVNHAQGHNRGENHANQGISSNVYSPNSESNRNYYDNRSKGKPYNSVRSSRRNMCDGYFPVYESFMDGNSEMPEMLSKNWADVERDRRSTKKLSGYRGSQRSSNSNYSLASIGATGLPSPVKPFHWVPNRTFFGCDYEYENQQHSFLHAALVRYGQQQQRQHELNYRNAIGGYPQGAYYANGPPQSEYQCNNVYNENSGSIDNNNCEDVPDDLPVACIESSTKLSFHGPIGILGHIAAKKYHKYKDSIEAADMKDRELRLNVWCDWDILLEATYVDSPRRIDELEDNKEESQVEEIHEQNPTNHNDGKAPVGRKHAAGAGVSGAVSGANEGFAPKAQNKRHGQSKKEGDAHHDMSHAQNCSGNISPQLENSFEVYLCSNSMMDLWDHGGRSGCGSLCYSDKSLAKSTVALTMNAPKASPGSHKSVEEPAPPLTSYDSGEGDSPLNDFTLQKRCLEQQRLNRKKNRTFARRVKKILNKLTFGSLFCSSDEVHYFVGVDSDSTCSGSTRNTSTDINIHSGPFKNTDPTRALGGPLDADDSRTQSVTSIRMPALLPSGRRPPKYTKKQKEAVGPADSETKLEGGVPTTIGGNYTCYTLSNFIVAESSGQIAAPQPNRGVTNPKDNNAQNNNSTNDNKSNPPPPTTSHSAQPMIVEKKEVDATKPAQEPISVNVSKIGVPAKLPVLSKSNFQSPSSSSRDFAKKGGLAPVEAGKPTVTLFANGPRASESREKGAPDRPKSEKLPNDGTELTPHPPSVALPKLSKQLRDPSSLNSGKN
ncbi:unnamed protein product [Phytomonas sp. EM1]|nr:unnamed protein product [Phytomonas sp. EM1]|eukprot:CCW64457.1 unnamed protein product [Phytomonas sp. isolate EM1]